MHYNNLRWKNFACDGFLDNSWKNIEKIVWELLSASLLSMRRMRMTYSNE